MYSCLPLTKIENTASLLMGHFCYVNQIVWDVLFFMGWAPSGSWLLNKAISSTSCISVSIIWMHLSQKRVWLWHMFTEWILRWLVYSLLDLDWFGHVQCGSCSCGLQSMLCSQNEVIMWFTGPLVQTPVFSQVRCWSVQLTCIAGIKSLLQSAYQPVSLNI